jgi:hypothetical protein
MRLCKLARYALNGIALASLALDLLRDEWGRPRWARAIDRDLRAEFERDFIDCTQGRSRSCLMSQL